jgi:hypothetical protein
MYITIFIVPSRSKILKSGTKKHEKLVFEQSSLPKDYLKI